jgi:hypothetical protein
VFHLSVRSPRPLGVLLTLLLCAATPAAALDGRIQISTAPYTISQSGSYVLTRNLSVTSAQTAITVNADFVTIDLNGFSIVGPNTCSYNGVGVVSCTASGAGKGIDAGSHTGIVVRNGSVRGTGSTGISTGYMSRVTDVKVSETGSYGISFFGPGIVLHATVQLSQGAGINCLWLRCLVLESSVREVSGDGIDSAGIVRGNEVSDVGYDGVNGTSLDSPSGGVLIEGNAVRNTGHDGIEVGYGAGLFDNETAGTGYNATFDDSSLHSSGSTLVVGNSVNSSTGASGYGLTVSGGGALVMDNTIRAHAKVGLNAAGFTCYGRNVLSQNPSNGVQVSGSAAQNAANACGRDITCP